MFLTPDQQKLLNMDLKSFPLMAAASAAIKGCPTCPHKQVNKHTILKAAALRLQYNKAFNAFLKQNFKLPITVGGVTFTEQ